MRELRSLLANCEIVDDQPDDPRGHSCRVAGWVSGKYIECAVAVVDLEKGGEPVVYVITVYTPEEAANRPA